MVNYRTRIVSYASIVPVAATAASSGALFTKYFLTTLTVYPGSPLAAGSKLTQTLEAHGDGRHHRGRHRGCSHPVERRRP